MNIPTRCPICSGEIHIETVRCDSCNTAITNNFASSVFDKLSIEQQEFLLVFVGAEGNIKVMEKKLGISYPTVKSRLSAIQEALGLSVKSKEEQLGILEQLENGQLSVEEAVKLLK